jgi:hypothetical protein
MSRLRRRFWTLVTVLAALLFSVSAVAAAMVISNSRLEVAEGTEHLGQAPSTWTFVSASLGATPTPAPVRVSLAVAAPTRLPLTTAQYLVNRGASGRTAGAWAFNESTKVAANQEWVINLQVHYTRGGVARVFATAIYIETQATAPAGTLTMTFYWDGGPFAGVVLNSEFELSQPCPAIGNCP